MLFADSLNFCPIVIECFGFYVLHTDILDLVHAYLGYY